ncbi:MAG: hypothetical protein A2925_02240 [Candidatus Yanofskybacteria bacterium RIFCSPLOWO2_01_FULL_44_22]|uniref:D-lactate dehydrogenase (cytochrome) n=2 Tax=Candidatus Yanofskyibacteriota TaxID=1752733 RepID=A0A1F8GJE6_9BACT|nr:MAG: Oxidoreductase [Candidatus Yanofskybacteria bacterium GW2011_GWA2_44_9]OGN05337.1 MAG: hypothetical protein A2659_01905 [Candidatus Yanofskybacteria bacterium RIFCSPHIGHO2_01_FULL_44_24]OGN25524.1 MAG: hypothetical protein A2925_02240 [Candidatus Yanofskybacteria bacterium RIFCSPLOWO2_01_FULL_44_22]
MIADEIKNLIRGDLSLDDSDLKKHSRDASLLEVRPKAVVYPKDSEDIKKLVGWVSENKDKDPSLSLTARSAGSDMSGGPLNESIILDVMRYMNKIHEVGSDYAVTDPGVYYRDFEAEVAKKDLLFPSYPASRNMCAMGGIIANNAGGEKSLIYGKTEKYVSEMRVVLSDGNEYFFKPLTVRELEAKKSQQDFEGSVYRSIYDLIEANYDVIQRSKPDVSKNSAGYYLWNVWDRKTFDLTKLFTGSQGTLGMITRVKIKLVKPHKNSVVLVVFLKDLEPLGDVVVSTLKYKPTSLESFDDRSFSIAMKFLPQLVGQLKGNLVSLFFKFIPEMLMVLTGGLPKLVLIAEFSGDDGKVILETVRKADIEIREKFKLKTRVITNKSEADKYWAVRRESFSLLRKHSGSRHTAPFIDDVIVHPRQLPEFLPRLSTLIEQYPALTYTIAGHAGDANFHVIPLMDFKNAANRKIISELSVKVYDLVAEMKGSITAEHNDGIVRTPYLSKMYSPEIIELFRKTKEIFDPQNIFNPGKKVGGSEEYLMAHIVTE